MQDFSNATKGYISKRSIVIGSGSLVSKYEIILLTMYRIAIRKNVSWFDNIVSFLWAG